MFIKGKEFKDLETRLVEKNIPIDGYWGIVEKGKIIKSDYFWEYKEEQYAIHLESKTFTFGKVIEHRWVNLYVGNSIDELLAEVLRECI